jgi:hypothetical protein
MRYAFVLLLALAGSGCDSLAFEPSGDPELTAVDPTPQAVTVDLAAADTVALVGPVLLRYDVEQEEGQDPPLVEVVIGGRTFDISDDQAIDSREIDDGTYPLVLRVTTASGTGSLADRYGEETVETVVERVAVVDNAPPSAPDLQSLQPVDGLLTVRWAPYQRFNVQAFEVYTRRNGGGWALRERISDRTATTWTDSSFVGGDMAVRVDAVGIVAGRAEGEPVVASYPVPQVVEAEGSRDGQIRLRWTGVRFPSAFERYVVVDRGRPSVRVVHTVSAVGDTSATFRVNDPYEAEPYVFGRVFRLAVQARSRDWEASVEGAAVPVGLDPWAGLRPPVQAVGRSGLVAGVDVETGRVALVDAETLERQAMAPDLGYVLAVVASPSGRLAALADRGGAAFAVDLDPATLAVRREVALAPYLPSDYYHVALPPGGGLGLTDGGEFFFGVRSPGSDFGGPAVYGVSLGTGRTVAQVESPYEEPDDEIALAAVSGDGRYLVTTVGPDTELWERDPDVPAGYRRVKALREVIGLDLSAVFVDATRLLVLDDGGREVYLLDVETGEQGPVFFQEFHTYPELCYDPVSGLATLAGSVRGYPTAIVFDPATGREVERFPSLRLSCAAGTAWSGGVYRRLTDD